MTEFVTFAQELRRLIDLSFKIVDTYDRMKGNLNLEKENPLKKCLKRYDKCFNKTCNTEKDIKGHMVLFQEIYDQNKIKFLMGPEESKWLAEGDVVIQYGSNMGLVNKVKIYISAIYEFALNIYDELKEKPHGEEEEEINYAEGFLFHLYRIFNSFVEDPKERTMIVTYISTLEENLGIDEGRNAYEGEFQMGQLGDVVGSILSALTNSGAIPEGNEEGGPNMQKALDGVFSNPNTKEMLGGLAEKLQKGSSNPGDLISEVVDSIRDPNMMKVIGDSVEKASTSASTATASSKGKEPAEPPEEEEVPFVPDEEEDD